MLEFMLLHLDNLRNEKKLYVLELHASENLLLFFSMFIRNFNMRDLIKYYARANDKMITKE